MHLPPLRLAALCALCLCLCACWLPERYLARIKIERDGTYKLMADGAAVHVESLSARRGAGGAAGAQKRQDEARAAMQKELSDLRADKRVISAAAIDATQARFSIVGVWKLDTSVLICREALEPLAYAVGPDGTLRIRVKDAVASREARMLGVKTEGDLSVVLAPGIEVLEHNAQSAPSRPGGAYRWQITDATDQEPYLKIRLPEEGDAHAAHAAPAHKPLSIPPRKWETQKGLARP